MRKPNRLKDLIRDQVEFDDMNDSPIVTYHDRINYHIQKIEKDLGFSLNDDDATEKLKTISDTINIPEILYQYAA